MSVTQTVEIPADHRLVIDVPPEVPAGPVVLTFSPKGVGIGMHGKTPKTADGGPDRFAWRRLQGCYKDIPGFSVDDFLADCHADKERELAIEKRQAEEHARRV